MAKSAVSEQLPLFDYGGLNLGVLREKRERLSVPFGAPLTVRGYASDWRVFDRWCVLAGRPSLPATADTVSLYVTWMLEEAGRRVSTSERHVSAIAHFHRSGGHPSPVDSSVRRVLLSVRRIRKETPCGRTALPASDLARVCAACDCSSNQGLRDRALLVLGFATALRRSNLSSLQLADVGFLRAGLSVFVSASKTDQQGRGALLGVWPGECPFTDPVRSLRAWIDARGLWSGPLFTRISVRGDQVVPSGLSGGAINELVKRSVARVGLDPGGYGAHSLRAGSISSCARLGRSDQEIMRLSGHASVKVMRTYIRDARLFDGRNPLAGLL
jgi:integrase